LGGIWGSRVKKDNFFIVFIGMLILIIVLTNPFTGEQNNMAVDVLQQYQSFDNEISLAHLSENEKKNLADEYIYMSRQLMKHDKYDEALDATQKAIKLNPYYDNIYSILGNIYLARAIRNNSSNTAKIINSDDFKQAHNYFQKNINEYPDLATSFDGMINLYESVQDYEMAIETATIGCYMNTGFKNRCKKVADLYLIKGERQQAIEFYNYLILKMNNNNVSWIYKRVGYIYHAQGNCSEAKKNFKAAYKNEPTSENLDAVMLTCYDNSLKAYPKNY
jgi:tetratricopeptide (TPR) repeat protein